MPFSVKILRELDLLEQPYKKILIDLLEEIEHRIGETVKREDFNALKAVVSELSLTVKELAEAQKRSEERLTRLEIAVSELAEAQKRTEKKVEELAEAQKRSEERLTRLEIAVSELAEAQKRTEKKVEELAEAQKRSEERLTRLEIAVSELAEAQKRTEHELSTLVGEHKKTREMLGTLTHTVGYVLEDKVMLYVPDFAKKEYDIDVTTIDRRTVPYPDGRYDEINVYVEGYKEGKKTYLIGECKAQPGKKDMDKFKKVLERLKGRVEGEVFGFVVGYTYSPEVEGYVKTRYPEIKLLKSHDFGLRYKRINDLMA